MICVLKGHEKVYIKTKLCRHECTRVDTTCVDVGDEDGLGECGSKEP